MRPPVARLVAVAALAMALGGLDGRVGAADAPSAADTTASPEVDRASIFADMRLRELRAVMSTSDSVVVTRLASAAVAGRDSGGHGGFGPIGPVASAHLGRGWAMRFADALAHGVRLSPESACPMEVWPSPGAEQLVIDVAFHGQEPDFGVRLLFHERCGTIREDPERVGRIDFGAAADTLRSLVREALPDDPVVRGTGATKPARRTPRASRRSNHESTGTAH